MEVWKDIPGLENMYEINNLGVVMCKPRKVISAIQSCGYRNIRRKVKLNQDNGKGYKQIYVQINNNRTVLYVHRIVAELFVPNPLLKKEVNHKNGNKSDNRAENLEWCTSNENKSHAVSMGLTRRGERSHNSKFTEKEVLAIRRLYRINPNFNKTEVGKKFGTGDSAIHSIIKRRTWKHI